VFIQDAEVRRALAERAHLVDMEGYAVARACVAMGVPCDIVKVVSDTADEGAAGSWAGRMDDLARTIAEVVAGRLT
jgi:adenosylhomocysteine nucleosidase